LMIMEKANIICPKNVKIKIRLLCLQVVTPVIASI